MTVSKWFNDCKKYRKLLPTEDYDLIKERKRNELNRLQEELPLPATSLELAKITHYFFMCDEQAATLSQTLITVKGIGKPLVTHARCVR